MGDGGPGKVRLRQAIHPTQPNPGACLPTLLYSVRPLPPTASCSSSMSATRHVLSPRYAFHLAHAALAHVHFVHVHVTHIHVAHVHLMLMLMLLLLAQRLCVWRRRQ